MAAKLLCQLARMVMGDVFNLFAEQAFMTNPTPLPRNWNPMYWVGDWEGDTVMGAKRKGALVTLVERKSRFLLAARLADKTADNLASTANRLLKRLPGAWHQTLTLDNGSEFSRFKIIEKVSKITVYFADPYASHQCGTNENTNGLVRQLFPKGKAPCTARMSVPYTCIGELRR
jgi:IS30 family transposase